MQRRLLLSCIKALEMAPNNIVCAQREGDLYEAVRLGLHATVAAIYGARWWVTLGIRNSVQKDFGERL